MRPRLFRTLVDLRLCQRQTGISSGLVTKDRILKRVRKTPFRSRIKESKGQKLETQTHQIENEIASEIAFREWMIIARATQRRMKGQSTGQPGARESINESNIVLRMAL